MYFHTCFYFRPTNQWRWDVLGLTMCPTKSLNPVHDHVYPPPNPNPVLFLPIRLQTLFQKSILPRHANQSCYITLLITVSCVVGQEKPLMWHWPLNMCNKKPLTYLISSFELNMGRWHTQGSALPNAALCFNHCPVMLRCRGQRDAGKCLHVHVIDILDDAHANVSYIKTLPSTDQ